MHDSYFGYVGIDTGWVYPQLAILPMLASWLFAWAGGYTIGWAVVVTLLDAAAFAVLIGRGRSNGRNAGAWFWLAFIALHRRWVVAASAAIVTAD
ncbi:hypothetical protein CJ026_026540 [Ralstonia pickettii]|uniref:hypothetical protein n=1 Tax=Ralstonia pickettii TaxID=329 RepID=UPI000CD51B34|nr:hypothetical protein CJ026_026540 [Ralstonia pickettii]